MTQQPTQASTVAKTELTEGDLISIEQYSHDLEVTLVSDMMIGVRFADEAQRTSTRKSLMINEHSGRIYLVAGTSDKGEVEQIDVVATADDEDEDGEAAEPATDGGQLALDPAEDPITAAQHHAETLDDDELQRAIDAAEEVVSGSRMHAVSEADWGRYNEALTRLAKEKRRRGWNDAREYTERPLETDPYGQPHEVARVNAEVMKVSASQLTNGGFKIEVGVSTGAPVDDSTATFTADDDTLHRLIGHETDDPIADLGELYGGELPVVVEEQEDGLETVHRLDIGVDPHRKPLSTERGHPKTAPEYSPADE